MAFRKHIAPFFAFFFSGYFLLAGLLPGTDFRQLQLVSNLFDHFQTHRQLAREAGSSESLWAFLWEHAISPGDHEDLSGHSHSDLPFQVLQPTVHLFLASLTLPPDGHRPDRLPCTFFESALYDLNIRRDIFHPPSLA